MQREPQLWRRFDILIPLLIILLACSLFILPFLNREGDTVALIRYEDKKIVLPLDVDTSRTIDSNGYTLTVKVKNQKVFVSESTCPDKICKHMGSISTKGETILCAKAGLSVTILSKEKGGFDAVAQ